jgi:diacylglycerol kinase family enzyme
MSPQPTHLLVGNPTAQSGKNAERIERARVLLGRARVPHAFLATLPGGRTVRAVSEALVADARLTTAIYMGGDGTFAEVAKGILGSGRADEVRLGMLPTGTANDQGKSFGLEADEDALERNVAVIAQGAEARLDAGRLRGFDDAGARVLDELFFDSAGWGISPRVLALRNEDRRLIEQIPLVRDVLRDQIVYAGALMRTFAESYVEDDKFDVEAVVDGRALAWHGLSDLVVKGTRVYGGLWVFDPDARPDDGRFEVVPFAGKRDWVSKAIVHLDGTGTVSESLETVGVRHSAAVSGARIELRFGEHPGGLPLAAQVDGEQCAYAPRVEIEVLARALRIVVPREHATGG